MDQSYSLFRSVTGCLFILFFPVLLWSQNCEVLNENLNGKYEGDCKKGKAHGHGKATGKDAYEGDFKSGLPDGKGTYTWSSGISFTGKWDNGLREGKGVMIYKTSDGKDSLIEGYWKKDIYIGQNEHPYTVHSRTGSVRDVDVNFEPGDAERVSVVITNTSGGTSGINAVYAKMEITDLQITKGSFQNSLNNNTHLKKSERIFMGVQFPFRAKIIMGREQVDIELHEKGTYIVDIRINQ